MATIAVIGTDARGEPARLAWDDGELEGPEALVVIARAAAAANADVAHPGLDRGTAASLAPDAHPETVAQTLAAGFGSVERVEGLPPPEPLPPGVVF